MQRLASKGFSAADSNGLSQTTFSKDFCSGEKVVGEESRLVLRLLEGGDVAFFTGEELGSSSSSEDEDEEEEEDDDEEEDDEDEAEEDEEEEVEDEDELDFFLLDLFFAISRTGDESSIGGAPSLERSWSGAVGTLTGIS